MLRRGLPGAVVDDRGNWTMNCLACHGGNATTTELARARWNMDVPTADLCKAFLSRMDPVNPSGSPAMSMPLQGSLDHPRVAPFASEMVPWLDWVAAEQK